LIICCVQIVWLYDNPPPLNEDETALFATVDGTHCRIYEQRKEPNSKWCSHKFKGPGLGYELVIDIYHQQLLYVHGPYRAGDNDISNFRKPEGIMNRIPEGKKLVGDSGYRGEPGKITTPNVHDSLIIKNFKNRARSRHETFNKRIKAFGILKNTFRSDIAYHQIAFEAICVLVQYDLENGHPLFEV
jgi:DDE superfamily endonuclease